MHNQDLWENIISSPTAFLIAEIGVNHENNIEVAKKMIDAAKEAGADAVKFQTYKAEHLAVKDSPAYWDQTMEQTSSQYLLFKKYDHFGEQEFYLLADYCKATEIVFLSTPFHFEAVDFLNPLVPFFKIASSDITNIPLLTHVAQKRKPILLSTGASTIAEIDEAINTIKQNNNQEIGLLHCILNYPTKPEDANLNMIKHLKNVYPDMVIGYSDHTIPDDKMLILTLAYLFGAQIIEKHFTLDKSLPGNDHYHAMDPDDIRSFKNNLQMIAETSGKYYKEPLPCEETSRLYARRSLVATAPIAPGQTITYQMLTTKRPGTGVSPKFINQVVGRTAGKQIERDQIITWDVLN